MPEKKPEISEHVTDLVDTLRSDPNLSVSLTDVASVTEVLVSISQRYFGTLDGSLYSEFRSLANYIEDAKLEIGKLRPNEIKSEKIPRAGKQLDAVVKATEEATQSIMDAAEEIMAADKSDPEAYAGQVDDTCMRIIEACAFQDITGQRITKVVETLSFIENRFIEIEKTWGGVIPDNEAPLDDGVAQGDDALLHGPQLDGEGIGQSEVDALLDNVAAANKAAEGASSSQSDIDAIFD